MCDQAVKVLRQYVMVTDLNQQFQVASKTETSATPEQPLHGTTPQSTMAEVHYLIYLLATRLRKTHKPVKSSFAWTNNQGSFKVIIG